MAKMENKEMLELAAKAAGYRAGRYRKLPHECLVLVDEKGDPVNPGWNPLIDDGDCARLEDVCRFDIIRCTDSVLVLNPNGCGMREQYADHGYDKSAARRLASTRAAAEIGRAM